jgi:hypothetical protein
MKNDNLPGLGPLWLISLAMMLGTLIVVLFPNIDSEPRQHQVFWLDRLCG